jgi:hypothetical protein
MADFGGDIRALSCRSYTPLSDVTRGFWIFEALSAGLQDAVP